MNIRPIAHFLPASGTQLDVSYKDYLLMMKSKVLVNPFSTTRVVVNTLSCDVTIQHLNNWIIRVD